jgi:hypothetical protein
MRNSWHCWVVIHLYVQFCTRRITSNSEFQLFFIHLFVIASSSFCLILSLSVVLTFLWLFLVNRIIIYLTSKLLNNADALQVFESLHNGYALVTYKCIFDSVDPRNLCWWCINNGRPWEDKESGPKSSWCYSWECFGYIWRRLALRGRCLLAQGAKYG